MAYAQIRPLRTNYNANPQYVEMSSPISHALLEFQAIHLAFIPGIPEHSRSKVV